MAPLGLNCDIYLRLPGFRWAEQFGTLDFLIEIGGKKKKAWLTKRQSQIWSRGGGCPRKSWQMLFLPQGVSVNRTCHSFKLFSCSRSRNVADLTHILMPFIADAWEMRLIMLSCRTGQSKATAVNSAQRRPSLVPLRKLTHGFSLIA